MLVIIVHTNLSGLTVTSNTMITENVKFIDVGDMPVTKQYVVLFTNQMVPVAYYKTLIRENKPSSLPIIPQLW